nr:hypothetical protein [uncultured archaeon]
MINILIVSGAAAIGLTVVILGGVLVIIKIRRYMAKKQYNALIKKKMSILAQLQEEDKEVPESATIPQTPLPAQFFEEKYTEVKQ